MSSARNEKEQVVAALAGNPDDLELIHRIYSICMGSREYDEAVKYGLRMVEVTDDSPCGSDRMAARAYVGQALLAADRYYAAYAYLSEGMNLWDSIKNEVLRRPDPNLIPVFILHNCMGIHAINCEMNYEKATEYFTKGLNIARTYSSGSEYSILGHNLMLSYFIREIPDGLEYAEELCRDGEEKGDEWLLFIGDYGSAMMYFLKRDYRAAERSVLRALRNPRAGMFSMEVYNLYANILQAQGRTKEAERNYGFALRHIDEESATTASYMHLSYGNFLVEQGEYRKAVELFERGLDIARQKRNRVFTYRLYRSLSMAYARLDRWESAFEAYQKYDAEKDNIFNVERERAISELTLKYETARKETELQENKVRLIRKNRALQLSIVALAAILIILLIIYTMYRHKDRMYGRIARQYREAIRKEKKLEERLRECRTGSGAAPTISGDKSKLIFDRLECLMREEKIYRDPTLSRDKMAELSGTNRTYVSKVINDRCGKSFSQYVNSYRINDALESLSDPDNDMPLKIIERLSGFSSSSAFFKIFREEVGMTPSKYREKILEVSRHTPLEE